MDRSPTSDFMGDRVTRSILINAMLMLVGAVIEGAPVPQIHHYNNTEKKKKSTDVIAICSGFVGK